MLMNQDLNDGLCKGDGAGGDHTKAGQTGNWYI